MSRVNWGSTPELLFHVVLIIAVVFSLVIITFEVLVRFSSMLGYKYFVNFVDDCRRCTWIFLINDRSKLFFIFQTFCAEMQNQFGVSICTFRSDNAC